MKCEYRRIIKERIKKDAVLLNKISQEIWLNPEIRFQEFKAHELLCDVLEKQGFNVQQQYILPTAFRAEYNGKKPGPTVAFLCEFDALPDIGHACGHNLIAEAGIGAAIAVKAVLEADDSIFGKVVVLGTPAEEGGGGKILLLQNGAFDDVDFALMIHPAPYNLLYPTCLASDELEVTYKGKETHAAASPWLGINALDAANLCYHSISLLRQHIKSDWRIHCIITQGGTASNVIPALSKLRVMFRALSTQDMQLLRKKLEDCFNGAAIATGCQVDYKRHEKEPYQTLISNSVLGELYRKYSEEMGIKFEDDNPKLIPLLGSTDMGDVTHVLPGIHPFIGLNTHASPHTSDFQEVAGKPESQAPILQAIEAMALVAIEVMGNPEILKAAQTQFKEDIAKDTIAAKA